MKVGDLVVRKMGCSIIGDMKGIILDIWLFGGATYYKIAWFKNNRVSDKWQDSEFELIKKSQKER